MESTEVLLERRQEGRQVWAQRVYHDGRVEDYRDRDLVVEEGNFVEHKIALKWRPSTILRPEEVNELIQALHSSGFFDLPEEIGDSSEYFDAPVFTWTVNLEDRQKTVIVVGPDATHNPAIKLLRELLTELTAAGYRRDFALKHRKV